MREVGFIDDTIRKEWIGMMEAHNRTLKRGATMKLLPSCITEELQHSSLDLFMLQMESRHLAQILDHFSSFGEKLIEIIRDKPEALFWTLSGPIIVERIHWRELCTRVMGILRYIGFEEDDFTFELNLWPDREILRTSAITARKIFEDGAYASDIASMRPTIMEQHAKNSDRDSGFKAAGDGLSANAAKRPRKAAIQQK
jgi:hypothetical protein